MSNPFAFINDYREARIEAAERKAITIRRVDRATIPNCDHVGDLNEMISEGQSPFGKGGDGAKGVCVVTTLRNEIEARMIARAMRGDHYTANALAKKLRNMERCHG